MVFVLVHLRISEFLCLVWILMDSNGNKPSNPVRRSSSRNESGNESQVAVEIGSESRSTSKKLPKSSIHSKPKSRFGEEPYYMDSDMFEENDLSSSRDQTAYSALGAPKEQHEKKDAEKKHKELKERRKKKKRRKKLMKWVGVFCTIGCLVASLTVNPLKNCYLWGLKIWKWFLLATVTLFGMIITGEVQFRIVSFIENFSINDKVFYFVYGLKKSVRVTLWLTLVLVTWLSLFDRSSHRDLRSKTTRKILDAITWALISLLFGSILWLVKTVSLKILASQFRVNRFFDRIQVSIFHHNVLKALLNCVDESTAGSKRGRLCFMSKKSDQKTIDLRKIEQLVLEKVTASKMKRLVNAFKSSQTSFFQEIDECYDQNAADGADVMEVAKLAATKIFKNIAAPGNKFIDRSDLLKVMEEETFVYMLRQFEVDETVKIDRRAVINWVVKVYGERKKLAHALADTKTAVKQLNRLVSVLITIVTAIIWLLLMEIATTKVLLFILSQFALAAFMFGNTCKTIFEAIIFVFVMHPFDVGDCCSVDGDTMFVEEMYILTTVFLKLSNEKVFFPNSVLATKSITNYYRSPNMRDTVEFSIAFATTPKRIGIMKERIKRYLEKHPQHWHPEHSVVVKEIEDLTKLNMSLCVKHTMNFQEWGEKSCRRSELVMEMKLIFEELNISYNLLPQTANVFPVEVP